MRRRVLILGLPYFGKLMTTELTSRGWNATYRDHPGKDVRGWLGLLPELARADLLYLISSRVDRRSPQALLAMGWRRPLVIHWVGTDVLFALEAFRAGDASGRLLRNAVHLADAPWLPDELREMGIHADYVPMPVPALSRGEPPPLPTEFRVLVYYPVDPIDREDYDAETIFRVIEAFPDVRFLLIPSPPEALPQPLPANLEARAWVHDMDSVYRETTVYLRLTHHDGTSFMAVESLSRGRHVIWPFPMPGVAQAQGFDAVSAALRDLLERHRAGTLGLNLEGRGAVLRDFDPERLGTELNRHLRAALHGRVL